MDQKIKNQRLIRYIGEHEVVAFENVYGSVTMIETFFHPADYTEYHNITTFAQARLHLGY